MTNQNKRERLIDSAAILFHQFGLTATSLADIAKHADIPIGNVYYYFKTKEELALAALNRRREQFAVSYAKLQESLDDPRQRLIEAVRHFETLRDEYTRYGCPIGKMVENAPSDNDSVAQIAAQTLADFVAWAERQFQQLGHSDAARAYATSLMAGIQGAAIMAKSFKNPQVVTDEINRLTAWLETLPNRKISLGKVGMMKTSSDAA